MSARFFGMISALLLTVSVSGCAPSTAPITSEKDTNASALVENHVDPAVVYANAQVTDGLYYSEGYFEHAGVTLHYVEAGQGELIIFYHGFPSFWFYFFDQMEAFKTNYRVVAVDGLGAGLSDKPDALEHYQAAALADHVDALARHFVGDQKFTLVGHDWGGALALAYAESRPERLRAVASFNAPSMNVFLDLLRYNEQQQKTSTYMAVMRNTPQQAVRDNPPGEAIWTRSYGGPLSRGEITQAEYDLFGAALRPAAASNGGFNWYRANVPLPDDITQDDYWPNPPGNIDVPALVVWGSEDRAFVLDFLDDMRAITPDITIEIVDGANHWTSMTHPEPSNAAIQKLLDRTAADPG